MPVSAREQSYIPSQIKSILDSYPPEAILKEFLQNSDDAKATKQIFILDGRFHPNKRLVDPVLEHCQGPALLAINDSVFSESDWKALKSIHGSNKTEDETKTGKYGLGFRACYHLTDNPHILSKNRLRIFDPHEEFKEFPGGLDLDTFTELEQYPDQVSGFQAAGVIPGQSYNGTVVRLPLRTINQAKSSKIRPNSFSVEDIRALFEEFVHSELGIVLLFLKHIKSVELIEVGVDGTAKAVIEISGAAGSIRSEIKVGIQSFLCRVKVSSPRLLGGAAQTRDWRIVHHLVERKEACEVLSSRLGHHLDEDTLQRDKLIPHVGLAMPLDYSQFDGPLFTLLPLPIYPGFPLCFHGTFALTPDRQHLKTDNDRASKHQREGLLVKWNRMVFDTLGPEAWVKLLQILIDEDSYLTPWMAWPATTPKGSYWTNLLPNLTRNIINRGLPIFPVSTFGHDTVPSLYVSFHDALFHSSQLETSTLELLARVGLSIVEPPPGLLPILKKQTNYTALNPKSACNVLSTRVEHLQECSHKEKSILLEFSLSDTSDVERLKNLVSLPLVPLTSGQQTGLTARSQRSDGGQDLALIIPSAPIEEELFGRFEPRMVALSTLPPSVLPLFINYQGKPAVYLRHRNARDIISYLERVVGTWNLSGVQAGPLDPEHINWIIRFWNNVDLPSDIDIRRLQRLHLIPTNANYVRKIEKRVLSLQIFSGDAVRALEKLGVQSLHPSILPSNPRISRFCRADTQFLMNLIDLEKRDSLVPADWAVIATSLTRLLSSSQQVPLQGHQLETFKNLRIFPTWKGANVVENDSISQEGDPYFIAQPFPFPCPVLPQPTTFVLYAHNMNLCRPLDSKGDPKPKDEPALLELVIDYWDQQPLVSQHVFIDRIIARYLDLQAAHQARFITFPFVTVKGSSIPPSKAIDPASPLHLLYQDEGLTPIEDFGAGTTKLRVLQRQGLLASSLTPDRVAERIVFLSQSASSEETHQKAITLIQLLDRSWMPTFAGIIQRNREIAWLPSNSGSLTSPSGCRDVAINPFLFDLCLSTMSGQVQLHTKLLREALGWNEDLPTDIVLQQLTMTLEMAENAERSKRLTTIIQELSGRFDQRPLAMIELNTLRRITNNREWIPSHLDKLLRAEHAMLTTDFIGGPFQQVRHSLLDCVNFLKLMGCEDRPTAKALLSEYNNCTMIALSSKDLKWIIRLLEELARHDDLGHYVSDLKLPGQSGDWCPFEQVYYNDLGINAAWSSDILKYPIHASIPSELCIKLRIPFLGSLNLGDDSEDEDDEEMSEDLVDRIKNVLKDYDIQFVYNEFVANASDAGAKKFSIFLDERRSFPSDSVVSQEFKQLQQCPSVILFNDATFTKEDFRGIRRIGQGSKRNRPGMIGKYGVGAFSVYHFTNLLMIISGKYVMILDPSGSYLPPRNGRKRTVLYRQLSKFCSQYPDQLEPFRGLTGFPVSGPVDEYRGTLFRLPLNTPMSSSAIFSIGRSIDDWRFLIEGYETLGQKACFFTQMEYLDAGRLSLHNDVLKEENLWSVRTMSRKPIQESQSSLSITDLRLSFSSHAEERWIVTTSKLRRSVIPSQFETVTSEARVCQSNDSVVIRQAFPLSRHQSSDFYLFAGLCLPQTIRLPFHLQAPFAFPSNRRDVQFGSRHNTGSTAYNSWLLRDLVSRHYMTSLEHLRTLSDINDLWWYWPVDLDRISHILAQSFYTKLLTSQSPIFRSLSGRWHHSKEVVLLLDELKPVEASLRLLKEDSVVIPPKLIRETLVKEKDYLKDHLHTLTPTLLAQIFRQHKGDIQTLYSSKSLSPEDIDGVLTYLLENEVNVLDIPLLSTVNGDLLLFKPSKTIYHVSRHYQRLIKWISPDRVLDEQFHAQSLDRLTSDPVFNIRVPSADDVCFLLQEKLVLSPAATHPDETAQWIQEFWNVLPFLAETPTPDSLADFPIVPTFRENHYVSLRHCRSGRVLPNHRFIDPLIYQVLISLNISMVGPIQHQSLRDFLGEEHKFTVYSLLRCLSVAMDTTDLREVPHFDALARWIRESPALRSDNLTRDMLTHLPIWEAYSGNRLSLHPLGDILLLPVPLSHTHTIIQHYARPNLVLSHDDGVARYADKKRLTAPEVLGCLRLPDTLPSQLLQPYVDFLRLLPPITISIRVPDGNCEMRLITDLYDFDVPLFAQVFQGTREHTNFIHPTIRHQLRLFTHLLQNEVNAGAVRTCAEAFQQDVGNLPETEARGRAVLIYRAFAWDLPNQVGENNLPAWTHFRNLRFIPREPRRCRHASYEVGPYFTHNQLPPIVSPSEVVSHEYERIAWTQLAILPDVPSDLLIVYPQFGLPSAYDVVEHLRFLALTIAPHHSQNRSLFEDLKATYQWLEENRFSAREQLLKHGRDPIFLNVDDPNSDDWSWCSARQLILGVGWDYPNQGTCYVRPFLEPYERLLLAAGAEKMFRPEYHHNIDTRILEATNSMYNKMRHAGQLTDLFLKPIGAGECVDLEPLKCHKLVLAATVPHFLDAFANWSEADSDRYSFSGSFIGAYSFLEFVYTGKISLPKDTAIEDENTRQEVEDELLNLLSIADQWDMEDFKADIGRMIVVDLRLLDIHNYERVKSEANLYSAPALAFACDDFALKNIAAIRRLTATS